MTTGVLDACALIALLRNEPGGAEVRALLADEACCCFIHAVNLCEVYYDCLRNYDEAQADQMIEDLTVCGLLLRDDMDAGFWRARGPDNVPRQVFHRGFFPGMDAGAAKSRSSPGNNCG